MTINCPVCRKKSQKKYQGNVSISRFNQKKSYLCELCKSYFLHPKPTNDEIANCYSDSYHEGYHKKFKKDYYRGKRLTIKYMKN